MKKTNAFIVAGVVAMFMTGCATTQQTASTESDRTRTAYTVPADASSLEFAHVGWTVNVPSDMP